MRFVLIPFLYIARIGLRIIYFFIKLFTKQKAKITMISRQSNDINIDFKMLKKELENESKNIEIAKKNIECKKDDINKSSKSKRVESKLEEQEDKIKLEIKILCKKIPNGVLGKINYCFYIVKCMYHIATSKVCITDGYNIAVSAVKHKKNTEIIQIWHAMGAIKKFGYQVLGKEEGSNSKIAKIMKMHANYTCVTCTSKETRKIYQETFNTDIEKIKVLGMPRIDYLLGKNNEINEEEIQLINDYPKLKEKKNIVYVPTFRKNRIIDVEKIINSVDTKKYNLIIRLHPLDTTRVNEEYKIDSKYSTLNLVKIADYVITDYSAVAFETAILDKQLFFYLYDIDEYKDTRGLNINLQQEMKNSTKTNIEDIINIIENNTYDYEELKKFKDKYVQTADLHNSERIVKYIRENTDVLR